MAEQQAGWYPDPSGNSTKLRYWDGNKWTSDFTDTPGQSSLTQPIQPAQTVPTPQAYAPSNSPYNYPNAQQVNPYYIPPAPVSQTNGLAIAALVCGVVGLCAYGIPSIVAIILGALGRKNPVQQGIATAGLILGIIGTLFWLLILIVAIVAAASAF